MTLKDDYKRLAKLEFFARCYERTHKYAEIFIYKNRTGMTGSMKLDNKEFNRLTKKDGCRIEMKIDFENFDFEKLISYMKNYECDGICSPNALDMAIHDITGTFGDDKDRAKLSGIMLDSGVLSKEEGMYIIN